MTFSTPLALLLLVCLPLVLYLGWPRQAYRWKRDITSLLLRTLIILLLVFSLAGAQAVQSANRLAVVFLVDVSDSVGQKARESELDFVRQSLPTMGPDDEAGVVLFGANAVVEKPLNNVHELGTIQSAPQTGNTNLEKAIRLALGMFPADAARRIVVLSDGRPTLGNSESAAELAAATGVEISYVQFTPEALPEVQVSNVSAPSTVNAGQSFDLSFTVESQAATAAIITILQSGAVLKREPINLRQGTTSYTIPLQAGGSGFTDFDVHIDPQGSDGFYQNNQLSTFSRVIGPPRVLLMYNNEDDIHNLLPVLQRAGLTVDTVTPEQLPIGLVPLAQYQSIIMVDVPATRLTQRMETIQSYVRDLGGGLVVIGGPHSYGPGGYFETPLEETIPLDSQIKDQKRLPQLTIAFVIDRSGSMGAVGPSGVENIELAKEAIIRSIDFMQPTDRAGVVSFDSQGYWIAHLQDVRDRSALQRLVGTLRTGGGTDIMAGMQLVAQEIVSDPSQRKHIVLLTDGGADPRGLVELSQNLYENSKVTTSVVAIGAGAAPFLADMAKAGGGNSYFVDTVEQIPTIFTQEAVLATRSFILETPFVPTISATSPIMDGITSAPSLLGYVATSAKQTAQVILRGPPPYNDPLLATWQYGLGRAVAFTSDATAHWGENWVNWSDFVRFWSQALRWTITEGKDNNIETRVVMEGEQAHLIVDARDNSGAFLNGLNLQLSIVDPTGQPTLTTLRQDAPGRYEATFTPETEGSYVLHIQGEDPNGNQGLTLNQTTGWVMSYSAEYEQPRPGDGTVLLDNLAKLTGGRSLKGDSGQVFAHNLAALAATTPMWPWMLLLTLLLLPLDIAVRRLIITRSDWQRLRQWAAGRAVVETTSERISTLMSAKVRGRQRAEASGGPSDTIGALRARRDQHRSESAAPVLPKSEDGQPLDKPQFRPTRGKPAAAPEGNVAGELLKKRKERTRQD
jgi:uncharacterized membrane protein